MARPRKIGAEILDGLRELKRGKVGRVTQVPDIAGIREGTRLSQAQFGCLQRTPSSDVRDQARTA